MAGKLACTPKPVRLSHSRLRPTNRANTRVHGAVLKSPITSVGSVEAAAQAATCASCASCWASRASVSGGNGCSSVTANRAPWIANAHSAAFVGWPLLANT